jgi:hypothetical protein
LGYSFLTSFLGYYFLAAFYGAGFADEVEPPILAEPALINYKNK